MNPPLDPRRIKLLDPAVVAVLKTKTPAERVAAGFAIHERVRLRQVGHFRRLHPEWADEAVECAAGRRLLLVSLNEPLRTILRSLDNFRERGSPRQFEGVVDLLQTRRDAIDPPEVEFFARFYGVLDLWQAVLQRGDSAA